MAAAALPSYPEMIMEAITALGNEDGSSKSAISEYLESKHQDLPAGHSELLAHHLTKMKDGGELEFVNNNYKKTDQSALKKRGRGRPPKNKTGAPSSPKSEGRPAKPKTDAPSSSPRPRGRPAKPKDPLAIAEGQASAGTPKRRGRPPKNVWGFTKKAKTSPSDEEEKPTSTEAADPASPAAPASMQSGAKKGRGRPPKAKPEEVVV